MKPKIWSVHLKYELQSKLECSSTAFGRMLLQRHRHRHHRDDDPFIHSFINSFSLVGFIVTETEIETCKQLLFYLNFCSEPFSHILCVYTEHWTLNTERCSLFTEQYTVYTCTYRIWWKCVPTFFACSFSLSPNNGEYYIRKRHPERFIWWQIYRYTGYLQWLCL